MKTTKTQDKISLRQLYAKGWTIRQAAEALERSPQHVAEVVRGRRVSPSLMARLIALPKQDLVLRGWREVVR